MVQHFAPKHHLTAHVPTQQTQVPSLRLKRAKTHTSTSGRRRRSTGTPWALDPTRIRSAQSVRDKSLHLRPTCSRTPERLSARHSTMRIPPRLTIESGDSSISARRDPYPTTRNLTPSPRSGLTATLTRKFRSFDAIVQIRTVPPRRLRRRRVGAEYMLCR